MCINHIAGLLIKCTDDLCRLRLACVIAIEILKLCSHLRRDLVFSGGRQFSHQRGILLGVVSRNAVNQTLQIAGNQNVHRR